MLILTRGYAEKEGDARTFNQKVRTCRFQMTACSCPVQLRPPVDSRELEIDSRTGMKVGAKLPGDDRTEVDVPPVRTTWPPKMVVGIPPPASSAVLSASASKKVAARGVTMGLSSGKRTGFLDRVFTPSRTSPLTATGPRLRCVSSVTTKSSVTSATMVGVIGGGLELRDLTLSPRSVHVDSPNGQVPPIVTGTFGGADFFHSLLGETTEWVTSISQLPRGF